MQRFHLTVALITTLAGCGGSLPSESPSTTQNVFGTDDRTDLRGSDAPYSAIGRLETGCTGTLIGKRLVLTAAHCVITTGTGAVKPELKSFWLNVVDGQPKEKIGIARIWYGTDRPDGENSERGKDWAVLQLARAVAGTIRPMTVATPDLTQLPHATSLAGYSTDRGAGNTASLHTGCSILQITGDRLLHDCDAKSGVSGGPMFVLRSGNAVIEGISVSEYRNGAADSVDAPQWSAALANVAISAKAFESTVKELLRTVDVGAPAPTMAGVLSKDNPYNPDTVVNPPPIDPPPPVDPIDPVDGVDTVNSWEIASMASVRASRSNIEASLDMASLMASTLQDIASDRNDESLRLHASDVGNAANKLSSTLSLTTVPSLDGSTPTRLAADLTSLVRARRIIGVDATNRCARSSVYCSELEAAMRDLAVAIYDVRVALLR